MSINFLYITYDFPPKGMQSGIRALEISKRLVKKKHCPIILTTKIEKNTLLNHSLIHEIPYSLNIHRTPFFEIKNNYISSFLNFFFRFDFYIGWVPFAYSEGRRILSENKNIKFIYASGPPFHTHIIGYLLKRKFQIPLILEYRDPWSFTYYYKKIKHRLQKDEQWLNRKINLSLEKRILQSSDMIITVSSALILFLKTNFPSIKNKPLFSITNGLNVQKLDNYDKNKDEEIIFTFTGRLYGKRSILPLLTIISYLKKENFTKDFRFSLKIFGRYNKKNLGNIVKKLDIEDIMYLGDLIPRSDALKEIKRCDIAVHIGENINYPTIAFKVWDYLSCRKKILYLGLENSYTANFLKRNDFGIIIPINDLIEGKKRLKRLLIDINNNRFNNLIQDEQIINFSWDNKATIFINKIIKNLVPNC